MKLRRALAAAPLLLLLILTASACVSVEKPNGWAAPVFDGSNILFTQAHDRLALASVPTDADPNSTIAWSFPDKNNKSQPQIKPEALYGDPVIDSGSVYLATYSGGVVGLDSAKGTVNWSIKPGDISGNIVSGAALGGDTLVFGTTDGHLYGVNRSNGSAAAGWSKSGEKYPAGIWATPIIKDGIIFLALMNGDIRAISLADHSEKWRFHTTGAIANIELLPDGRIFAPSLNKHVYLLDSATGTERSDFPASDWVWTQPAVKDGIAYFGDFGGKVYAVDISSDTPKLLWTFSTGGARVKSGPQIVDDVVVIADRKPAVNFVNAKDGSLLNSVPVANVGTFRADLVQKDGVVYAVTSNGRLFKADPKSRSVVEITVGGRQ